MVVQIKTMKKDAQHQAKYWLCNSSIHLWVHIAGNYNPVSDTTFWRRNKKDKKYKFYPYFLTKNQTAVKALSNFSYTKLHAHDTNQIFWKLNAPHQVIQASRIIRQTQTHLTVNHYFQCIHLPMTAVPMCIDFYSVSIP